MSRSEADPEVDMFLPKRKMKEQENELLLYNCFDVELRSQVRFMYTVDKRPFGEVMDAVGSNRNDPEGRPVVMALERSTR